MSLDSDAWTSSLGDLTTSVFTEQSKQAYRCQRQELGAAGSTLQSKLCLPTLDTIYPLLTQQRHSTNSSTKQACSFGLLGGPAAQVRPVRKQAVCLRAWGSVYLHLQAARPRQVTVSNTARSAVPVTTQQPREVQRPIRRSRSPRAFWQPPTLQEKTESVAVLNWQRHLQDPYVSSPRFCCLNIDDAILAALLLFLRVMMIINQADQE